MSILTLSEKQQKQLLKLCKEFFPEYTAIEVCTLRDDFKINDYFVQFKKWELNKMLITEDIHWYQLCMTELPKKIWENFTKEVKNSAFSCFICLGLDGLTAYEGSESLNYDYRSIVSKMLENNDQHLIDYLWDFVQECKKNNYFK